MTKVQAAARSSGPARSFEWMMTDSPGVDACGRSLPASTCPGPAQAMTELPKALLTKATIQAMPATRRVHDLNPNAVRDVRRLGEATGLSRLGVNLVTLQDGHESSEYHRHHYEEEAVQVLSGQGIATLDETEHPIAAGDFLGFPAGGPAHVIRQQGNEPLVLLVIGQRLEHDVCDYPRLGQRLYVAGEMEAFVALPAPPVSTP